ncbi:MAG: transcriptional regulator [Candidatus Bathyarchaeia archaeon]
MNDKALGAGLLVGGILGFIGYIILLITSPILALQIIAIIAVGALCVILAWIGYTLITTPAPAPIEAEAPPPTETATSTATSTSVTPEQKKT